MKMISKCLFVTVLSGVWIGSGCQMLRKQSATDASTFPRAHTTSSDSGAGSQEDHPSAKGTEPRSRVSLKDVNYGVDGRPEDLDREAQLTPVNLEFAKALAHYSQGMLHAQHREAGLAATNFLQSLEHNLTDPATYLKASEKIYDQAKELIRDDERDRALYILQRLTELLPERADPHIWKAVIHQAYKQNDRAESEYAAAIKQRPGTIGPYLELARIQFSSRQTDAAILTLKEGTKHAREPLKAHYFLAEIFLKQADAAIEPDEVIRNRSAAIKAFETALSLSPEDKTALLHLGRLYIKSENFAKGLGYYIRVDQLDPDNLSFKEQLVEDMSKAVGDPLITRKRLLNVLQADAKNAYALFYLGVLYEQGALPERARGVYMKAAKLEPAESSSYWKAALLTVDDDIDAAQTLLEQGLLRLPDNSRITEMLAFIYLQQKRFTDALTLFEQVYEQLKAKGVDHQAQNFHYNFALAAQGAGHLDQAAKHLILASVLNPAFLAGFVQHVVGLDAESRYRDGLQTLRKVSLDVIEPEVHLYIGLLSARARLFEAAISAYAYAETMAQGHTREAEVLDDFFYFSYGSACEQVRKFDQAEIQLERCIAINRTHIEAYNYLAFMWSEQGVQLDKALSYVNKALQEEPDNGAFLDTRGWIYYMKGDYGNARADLDAAHAQIPDDATIKDHLGDVHARLDQPEEARSFWQAALDLDPENAVLAEKLKSGVPTASARP